MGSIPELALNCGGSRAMPLVGLGTASNPLDSSATKLAVVEAIRLGYRHFDTAALYYSEPALGEAIAEALCLGLINSRSEVFITSKLWCSDAHQDLVLPALQKTLRNLNIDYLDLYLIHYPLSSTPGKFAFPIKREDFLPIDLKAVWEAMEECQRLGLTKSIGVSNFSCEDIDRLLIAAKVPPAVNQVEMNPVWQQKKMREFCREKGIHVTAFSPLGGVDFPGSKNQVLDCEVLKEIARARGKTVAQVSLRWLYEQGVSMVVKSFNKERLKENLQIFDWELTEEESYKISQIKQSQKYPINVLSYGEGPFDRLNFQTNIPNLK